MPSKSSEVESTNRVGEKERNVLMDDDEEDGSFEVSVRNIQCGFTDVQLLCNIKHHILTH